MIAQRSRHRLTAVRTLLSVSEYRLRLPRLLRRPHRAPSFPPIPAVQRGACVMHCIRPLASGWGRLTVTDWLGILAAGRLIAAAGSM